METPCGQITWLSPLRKDEFAEYQDADFLDLLGVELVAKPLQDFWPLRGPVWDGLGQTDPGPLFLVEAKSHVNELQSSGTSAAGPSLRRIRASLAETKSHLNVAQGFDWATSAYYQMANRLAHLYLFRILNGFPAYLVPVYFLNDGEMDGPTAVHEWEEAICQESMALGIPPEHPLKDYVISVFLDVNEIRRSSS